jgi:hypothetical protein
VGPLRFLRSQLDLSWPSDRQAAALSVVTPGNGRSRWGAMLAPGIANGDGQMPPFVSLCATLWAK